MGVFNAILLSTVFGGVGNDKFKIPVFGQTTSKEMQEIVAHNQKASQNWIGVINFAATDQFIGMSMSQVMVIPRQKKIFNRERANNMYNSTSYFLAVWLIQTLLTILYPVISTAISFHYLGFDDYTF